MRGWRGFVTRWVVGLGAAAMAVGLTGIWQHDPEAASDCVELQSEGIPGRLRFGDPTDPCDPHGMVTVWGIVALIGTCGVLGGWLERMRPDRRDR